LCYALTKCTFTSKLEDIIHEIITTGDTEYGLIAMNFSPPKRSFFTEENAMKIDACRQKIDLMYIEQQISYDEFIFLLASLICSASRIANTCGTFRAYLKTFSNKSRKPFILSPIHKKREPRQSKQNKVLCKNAVKVFSNDEVFDVVYMDPPYNNIQYGAYYSLLNYLCRYDPNVKLKGVGICENYNKSKFAMKKTCKKAFFDLFNAINSKHVFMSYSSYGLLDLEEILNLINAIDKYKNAKIKVHKFEYKKYKHKKTQESNIIEYLIHIDRT
jgi:adenine-specific DNA-methyltransferase